MNDAYQLMMSGSLVPTTEKIYTGHLSEDTSTPPSTSPGDMIGAEMQERVVWEFTIPGLVWALAQWIELVKSSDSLGRKRLRLKQRVWGIPRGGSVVATMLAVCHPGIVDIVDEVADAEWVVDDVIDTGLTMEQYAGFGNRTWALVDLRGLPEHLKDKVWIRFPWEKGEEIGRTTSLSGGSYPRQGV